jgi:hypothetical protein
MIAPAWLTLALLAAPGGPVQVTLDTAEAGSVLAIRRARAQGRAVEAAAWQKLFATDGYVRLKQREAGLKRDFTDEEFRRFVESEDLARRAPELERTLGEWVRADLNAAGRRILGYLPAGATIRATVYVTIKPRTNSFVHDLKTNPAVFLYLDPALDSRQFENTVAHELHHIGYASLQPEIDARMARLAPRARRAAEWVSAFGEGFAMLAAAGGPDVHPHATSPAKDRQRWDASMAGFNGDLAHLEDFFLEILDGQISTDEEARAAGMEFFGVQGAWYTVGWRMAATIERKLGRAELLECMLDPARLLSTYNRVASEDSARWSGRLIEALRQK